MLKRELPKLDEITWDENNKGYFVSFNLNAIFEIDYDKKEYSYFHSLEEKEMASWRRYTKSIKLEDKIFVFPVNQGEHIIIYNIKTDKISHIENEIFETEENQKETKLPFLHEGKIYICMDKELMIINPEDEIIESIVELSKKDELVIEIGLSDNVFYCIECCDENNNLVGFNLETGELQKETVPKEISGNAIFISSDEILAISEKEELSIYNTKDKTIRHVGGFPADFGRYVLEEKKLKVKKLDKYSPYDLCYILEKIGRYVFLVPARVNKFLYYDILEDKIGELIIPEEDEDETTWDIKNIYEHKYMFAYVKDNRYLGVYSRKNSMILEIDAETLTYKYQNFLLGEKNLDRYMKECGEDSYQETYHTTLEWFLSNVI